MDAPCAVREPAIPLAINRVVKLVEEVDVLCGMLEKRLVTVSVPMGPSVARDPEKKQGCGVPLALQIEGITERLQIICRRVRDQIDRIELAGA